MKKTSRNIIILAAVLLLFAGLAPRFLLLELTKDTIAGQLSSRMGVPISIEKIHWIWLPFPYLSVSQTDIDHEQYRFSAQEMRIYPNWRAIFSRKHLLGKIHLKHPEFLIKEEAFAPNASPELSLPELSFYINKGKLKIESGDRLGGILPPDTHVFNEIDGVLKMTGRKAELNFHGSTPFSRNIGLQGDINLENRNYRFFLDLQNIRLHESFDVLLKGLLIPVKSNARIAGTVTGTGLQRFEAKLHGTLPSFRVSHRDRQILIAPGFADFIISGSDQLLRLTINDLEIKEPQLSLSGLVERKKTTTATTGIATDNKNEPPIWTLDLKGDDLDLTSVRKKILALWDDKKITRTVCGIVLSGMADTAAYRFSGTVADFHRLGSMIIEADVRNADIHVPEAELVLSGANGPILIKDSILSGHGLSARLGSSFGSNGTLLLALADAGDAFRLNIDVDADLKDLPPVLKQLVKHRGFQRELAKFSETDGRAYGNLRLGENLSNVITRVRVDNMQLHTRYSPIPEIIFVDRGSLHVGPQEVSWQETAGRIGLQEIKDTGGSVSWRTGEPLLHIENIRGEIDGGSLYAMLEQTGSLPERKVKQKLAGLQGGLSLSGGSVRGPAKEPRAWEYSFDIRTEDLIFKTPLLPEQVAVQKLSAVISHKDVHIKHADISFLDQPLILAGRINHQELEGWHGAVQFDGSLRGRLANWLVDNGWLGKLQPRFPCNMENLTLGFKDESISLDGIIHQGSGGLSSPKFRINLEATPGHLRIKELTFSAPGEHGSLALEIISTPARHLEFSWQGFVNADTIDALFKNSPFVKGTFGGAFFHAAFTDGQPEATRFKGLFRAEDLLLRGTDRDKAPPDTAFKNILLSGVGEQLNIASIIIAVGSERIGGQGQIAAAPEGLLLDLDLGSSRISEEALDRLVHDLRETYRVLLGNNSRQNGKNHESSRTEELDMSGRIGFDIDTYLTRGKTSVQDHDADPVHSVITDMHGEMQLGPGALTRTEIFSSNLCELVFKSAWYSDETLGQHYELASTPDEELLMENVLPCLGFTQDLLEGDFSLKARLKKESGIWQSGDIHIRSNRGRILRLKLLSKIFKVVNITDLFDTQVDSTDKKGFPYSRMDIDAHISEGSLIFDRAIINGEGINLFLDGTVRLADNDTDLTLLVAPFKTVDTLVSKVPLIGQPLMSGYDSLVTLPVAIKGPLSDPLVTPLHPKAVGDALFNFVKETFKLPYTILKPHERPLTDSQKLEEMK